MSYDPSKRGAFFARYFYDVIFFLIIKLAILNVVYGIIIDTFAHLREVKNDKEEDMENVCFICGIERAELD